VGSFTRFLYTENELTNVPLLWGVRFLDPDGVHRTPEIGEGGESSEPGEGWVNAGDCA